MKIRSLKLKDHNFGDQWATTVENHWDYGDFLRDPHWRKDWISFDGVVHHAGNDRVYCGITSFDGDIFYGYDRRTGRFVDLGFRDVGNRFDAKFHRSMQLTRDAKTLYCATALLHDIDQFHAAPGGGIYAHDTATGANRKLSIPIPHVYIQSIALDEQRGALYCLHFTPERLSRFDLATGQVKDLGPIGSGMFIAQGENLVLDDDGCVWCAWGLTRAWQSDYGPDAFRICKYDPRQDRIIFFQTGLPRRDAPGSASGSAPESTHGFAKVEGLFNLGTGCLFGSGDNGSLYRIDHHTAAISYLGTPIPDRPSRLTNLVMARDGHAYGITGRAGQCQLLRVDPRTCRWELGGPIVDEHGVAMWQCHDLTITPDGVIYAGENDHPRRSSYLWEISGAL